MMLKLAMNFAFGRQRAGRATWLFSRSTTASTLVAVAITTDPPAPASA
jgi:hypothetical protein